MEKNFECKQCNFKTDKKGNYNRHLKTKKHLDIHRIEYCNLCDYNTNKNTNLIRHINKYHNKQQKKENNEEPSLINLTNLEINLQKILKEQENIKKLIPKNIGNTIINNKLSINVFLNTQCKDAMSIQDFLNQLQFSLDDLKYTKNNGYVEGISNMFVKELENLDPKERPIHCSDKKRLQFYVKTPNKWEKDDDKAKLRKAVKGVAYKNERMRPVWYDSTPDVGIMGTENYENFFKYSKASLGGYGREETKSFEDKVMKNVLKEVTIDKQMKIE